VPFWIGGLACRRPVWRSFPSGNTHALTISFYHFSAIAGLLDISMTLGVVSRPIRRSSNARRSSSCASAGRSLRSVTCASGGSSSSGSQAELGKCPGELRFASGRHAADHDRQRQPRAPGELLGQRQQLTCGGALVTVGAAPSGVLSGAQQRDLGAHQRMAGGVEGDQLILARIGAGLTVGLQERSREPSRCARGISSEQRAKMPASQRRFTGPLRRRWDAACMG
jgi:hypothetical protein